MDHPVRQKNVVGRFYMPPQPNGALQNYSILLSGYHSVTFLDTKCTVGPVSVYSERIAIQSVQKKIF